jgi:hypothetical protein
MERPTVREGRERTYDTTSPTTICSSYSATSMTLALSRAYLELGSLHAFYVSYRTMDWSRMDLYMTTSYVESLGKAVPLLSLTSRRANFTLENDPTHKIRPFELKVQDFGTYQQ